MNEPLAEGETDNKAKNGKAMNDVVRCVDVSHLEDQNRVIFQRKTIGTKKRIISLKCQDGRSLADLFKEFDSDVRAYKSSGDKVDDTEIDGCSRFI